MSRDAAFVWGALMAPAAAWFLDLFVSYALVPPARHASTNWALHLTSLGAFAVAGVSLGVGLAELRRVDERYRFLALGAVVLSAFFVVVLAAQLLPKLVLGTGLEP